MPGYLCVHQVPPNVSCVSSTTKLVPGDCLVRCQAEPTPEMPAPTISTSKCSVALFDVVSVAVCTFMARRFLVIVGCVLDHPGMRRHSDRPASRAVPHPAPACPIEPDRSCAVRQQNFA